jgi:hypothetical protein
MDIKVIEGPKDPIKIDWVIYEEAGPAVYYYYIPVELDYARKYLQNKYHISTDDLRAMADDYVVNWYRDETIKRHDDLEVKILQIEAIFEK